MCYFWAQNSPFVLNKKFLVQTIIITFIYLLALFIVQNLKKNFTVDPELSDAPFLGPKWFICPNFFLKIINIILMFLVAPFIVQNLKNFFWWIQSYEDAQFLGPKWPICPNENFFKKPVNEPCFFHSCLSTGQRSKSDINLLVKYWRLKNTEFFLAITWGPDFPHACSFCRMLMNHK